MIRAAVIVTVLSASLLAAGCQNSHPEKAEGSQDATSRIATQPSADPARAQRKGELSAAAEQFEMLTEEAFSADPARLASLLADAELSARSIEPQLPSAVADKLNMRIAELIEVIAPPLCHLNSLVPVSSAMIGGPHLVLISMGQSSLDSVGVPLSALVKERGCHRSKAVRRHFVARIAQPTQCRVHPQVPPRRHDSGGNRAQ